MAAVTEEAFFHVGKRRPDIVRCVSCIFCVGLRALLVLHPSQIDHALDDHESGIHYIFQLLFQAQYTQLHMSCIYSHPGI